MSMPPLNLASRPFRNERLPALLLALGFTAVGAASIKHALAVRSLLPGRTSGLARQVEELEKERDQLRREEKELRAPRPEASVLAQWTLLKDLVDSRTFSWTGLFALMEETLPSGVRLVSIAPDVDKGERTVEIRGIARGNDDLLDLIRVLEDRPEFDDVLPSDRTLNEQNQIEFRLAMKYRPQEPPPVMAASNKSPAAPPSPSTDAAPGESPSASPAASPGASAVALPSPSVAPSEPPSLLGPSSPAEAPSPSPSPAARVRPSRRPPVKAPERLE